MNRKTLVLFALIGTLSLSTGYALAVDQEQVRMEHHELMKKQVNERIDLPFPNVLLAREGAMGPGGGRGPGSEMGPGGDRGPGSGMGPGSNRGPGGDRGPGGGMGPGGDRGPGNGMGSGGNRGY